MENLYIYKYIIYIFGKKNEGYLTIILLMKIDNKVNIKIESNMKGQNENFKT